MTVNTTQWWLTLFVFFLLPLLLLFIIAHAVCVLLPSLFLSLPSTLVTSLSLSSYFFIPYYKWILIIRIWFLLQFLPMELVMLNYLLINLKLYSLELELVKEFRELAAWLILLLNVRYIHNINLIIILLSNSILYTETILINLSVPTC